MKPGHYLWRSFHDHLPCRVRFQDQEETSIAPPKSPEEINIHEPGAPRWREELSLEMEYRCERFEPYVVLVSGERASKNTQSHEMDVLMDE